MAQWQKCEYCKKLIGKKKDFLTITLDDDTVIYLHGDCLLRAIGREDLIKVSA